MNKPIEPTNGSGAKPDRDLPLKTSTLATLAALLLPNEAKQVNMPPEKKGKMMDVAINDAMHLWFRARLACAGIARLQDMQLVEWFGSADIVNKYYTAEVQPLLDKQVRRFYPDNPTDDFRDALRETFAVNLSAGWLMNAMEKWMIEEHYLTPPHTFEDWKERYKNKDEKGRTFYPINHVLFELFGEDWANRENRHTSARSRRYRENKRVKKAAVTHAKKKSK